MYIICI